MEKYCYLIGNSVHRNYEKNYSKIESVYALLHTAVLTTAFHHHKNYINGLFILES